VRLDEAHDDVDAAPHQVVRLGEHAERLADAGCRANVELEPSPLATRDELDEVGLRGRARRLATLWQRRVGRRRRLRWIRHARNQGDGTRRNAM
jgi:hypothetical protein